MKSAYKDTPANSLREKTLESSSVCCVARSANAWPILGGMWRLSTFQEVTNMSATSVIRSLALKASGPHIAQ